MLTFYSTTVVDNHHSCGQSPQVGVMLRLGLVIQGHKFVDTLGWIRARKDKDKLAEVGQFWGSLKA